MADTQSIVLAALAASYIVPDQSPSVNGARPKIVTTPKAPKARKTPKASKSDVKPLTAAVMPSNMPEKGTLNAREFLLAFRDSGKRQVEGKTLFHPNLVRDDIIRAMAGYVGYDPTGDFGTQDQAARSKAQLELKPIVGEEYKRVKVAQSIGGFVSGIPDNRDKRTQDLLAREAIAVDELSRYQYASEDLSRSETDRDVSATMARLESERIEQIRKDIASMG